MALNGWDSHNTLSLDASIALSAGAAFASLLAADSALFALPMAGAAAAGIAVALLHHKRQDRAR